MNWLTISGKPIKGSYKPSSIYTENDPIIPLDPSMTKTISYLATIR